MSVLGIGGPELILIVVLVILILGPERAPQAARALGKQWRTITSAEWWQGLLEMWHFMRHLPQNLAEFSEVKEIQATLSNELEQVQSLTKGIQSDVESVSKPIEAALGGTLLQDTMQEMSDELTQSLPKIGAPASTTEDPEPAEEAAESVAETIEPPAETAELPAEAAGSAARAEVPAKSARLAPGIDDPGLDSPPPAALGQESDDQQRMLVMAEQISEQIDQLPITLARLEELENQQSELEGRLERLQKTLDAILEQPKDGAEDEAGVEPPDAVE